MDGLRLHQFGFRNFSTKSIDVLLMSFCPFLAAGWRCPVRGWVACMAKSAKSLFCNDNWTIFLWKTEGNRGWRWAREGGGEPDHCRPFKHFCLHMPGCHCCPCQYRVCVISITVCHHFSDPSRGMSFSCLNYCFCLSSYVTCQGIVFLPFCSLFSIDHHYYDYVSKHVVKMFAMFDPSPNSDLVKGANLVHKASSSTGLATASKRSCSLFCLQFGNSCSICFHICFMKRLLNSLQCCDTLRNAAPRSTDRKSVV